MGRYPEFFYDDEPFDPCDSCTFYVDGICISDDGCCASILSQEEVEEIREKLGVTDKW